MKPPSEAPTNTGFGGRSTQYFEHIAGEGGDAIVPVVGPVGLAVATEVERDRLPSALGHRGGGAAPGSAGLTAAVQEDHRGCEGIADPVADDPNAAVAGRGECLRCRSHLVFLTWIRPIRGDIGETRHSRKPLVTNMWSPIRQVTAP